MISIKKERQRYILFDIIRKKEAFFSEREFLKVLWRSIWHYFGLKVSNKVGLWLVELNLEKEYGIVRCTHKTKEIMISVLALITEINKIPVILSPIKTYGTIRALKKNYPKFIL